MRLRSILLLTCSTAFAGCSAEAPAVEAPRQIVLVTIDTLRADHCSLYGYARDTTPFLRELAESATVFENTSATSSWTAPSMASLFTSLPPRSHGVLAGNFRKEGISQQDYLDERFSTLPETLSQHGYETFGVSTNAHLTHQTGFGQGFDELTALWWKDAEDANTEALAFAERLEDAERSFLWVHYFDPHYPYEAREPWFESYQAEERTMPEGVDPAGVHLVLDGLDRYDSEINHTDASLRRLFRELAVGEDALVVVTSDHGEAFFEHGRHAHGLSLFEEETRVPLLIRYPGQTTAARVETPVSILDVYPTLLELASLPVPPGLAGRSLAAAVRGEPLEPQAIVSELDRSGRIERTLRWKHWKLYRQEQPSTFTRLYDLEKDPDEQSDLAADQPKKARELARRWDEWADDWPRVRASRQARSFGEAELEKLRVLGYLESED